jgi:hypothetical protein
MSYLQDRLEEIARAPKPRVRYSHIEVTTTRHGRKVYYYRVGKGRRIRLPDRDKVSDEDFRKAYELAATGKIPEAMKRGHVAVTYGSAGDPGYVYFVRVGRQVKIGFTKSVKQRVKAIQTSCADPVEVLTVMPGTTETEKYLHSRFADYHTGGEWFSLTGVLADFLGYKIPR